MPRFNRRWLRSLSMAIVYLVGALGIMATGGGSGGGGVILDSIDLNPHESPTFLSRAIVTGSLVVFTPPLEQVGDEYSDTLKLEWRNNLTGQSGSSRHKFAGECVPAPILVFIPICRVTHNESTISAPINLALGRNQIVFESEGKEAVIEIIRLAPIPLDAPTGVSVSSNDTEITLSWNPVADATHYYVYFASSPGVTQSNYQSLPDGDKYSAVTSAVSITGLTTGTTYYFVVTAAHSHGESDESQEVTGQLSPKLSFDTKTFRFTWGDDPGSTHYRLLENPDGISGFSQVGNDIPPGIGTYDHIVALYHRINASYILQFCNAADCIDRSQFNITDNLVDAIGFIKAGNPAGNFGNSISLSGDGKTLVVGARSERSSTSGINSVPDTLANRAGAVYVFIRDGAIWSQQAYIKASNTDPDDYFGYSVSLSDDGNTLAVGANQESSSTTGINSTPDNAASFSGAVYLFTRSGTDWSQQAYVKASNTSSYDYFGHSVSLSADGNSLAVGASQAVYLFTRGGIDWSQQAYINGASHNFGSLVSLSADANTLAVGAYLEDSGSGTVYLFTRSGTDWSQQAYVKASNTDVNDHFGHSVSLSADGNTLAVGASQEDSSTSGINSIPNHLSNAAGAAYVFVRSGSDWSQQAYIKASNTGWLDKFGYSVSLSADGNSLAVGARGEGSGTTGINSVPDDSENNAGAAYLYIRSGIDWNQQAYIKANNTDANDSFGYSIDLSDDGNTLAIGAIGTDAAYLY